MCGFHFKAQFLSCPKVISAAQLQILFIIKCENRGSFSYLTGSISPCLIIISRYTDHKSLLFGQLVRMLSNIVCPRCGSPYLNSCRANWTIVSISAIKRPQQSNEEATMLQTKKSSRVINLSHCFHLERWLYKIIFVSIILFNLGWLFCGFGNQVQVWSYSQHFTTFKIRIPPLNDNLHQSIIAILSHISITY